MKVAQLIADASLDAPLGLSAEAGHAGQVHKHTYSHELEGSQEVWLRQVAGPTGIREA
jgi:hypothetical protein